MCVEISSNNTTTMNIKSTKKVSYAIKKLLKQLFKQDKSEQQLINIQNLENDKKAASLESLESLENSRNADIESECASLESHENDANERISAKAMSCEVEDYEFTDITTVPVHFVRTEHGTFFWTATTDIPADNDLVEPLCCSTTNQIACMQDRWAQA